MEMIPITHSLKIKIFRLTFTFKPSNNMYIENLKQMNESSYIVTKVTTVNRN